MYSIPFALIRFDSIRFANFRCLLFYMNDVPDSFPFLTSAFLPFPFLSRFVLLVGLFDAFDGLE